MGLGFRVYRCLGFRGLGFRVFGLIRAFKGIQCRFTWIGLIIRIPFVLLFA